MRFFVVAPLRPGVCARVRIQYLEPIAPPSVGEDSDVTAAEAAAPRQLASQPEERLKFWAIFWAEYAIHAWGFDIYRYMHECPKNCPACEHRAKASSGKDQRDTCPFRGRHMIALANGECHRFLQDLEQLTLSSFSEPARKAMDEMRSANLDQGRLVEAGFELAKKKVYLRFQQGSSFYSTYPWNICKLLAYVMQPAGPARTGAIADSRRFARELLGSNLPSNTFADKFFNGTFKEQMEEWAGGAGPMPTALFRELLSYSLSLVAMQRLESRHHLVNLRLQPSRASSAAQVSAHLRRKLNNDIRDDRFRLRLERYLHEFEKLVPEKAWQNYTDLCPGIIFSLCLQARRRRMR